MKVQKFEFETERKTIVETIVFGMKRKLLKKVEKLKIC